MPPTEPTRPERTHAGRVSAQLGGRRAVIVPDDWPIDWPVTVTLGGAVSPAPPIEPVAVVAARLDDLRAELHRVEGTADQLDPGRRVELGRHLVTIRAEVDSAEQLVTAWGAGLG